MKTQSSIRGFSLIELMIVIAIIGILTTIALPSYHNYTQQARFTELLVATEPFKTAVTLALQQGLSPLELKNNMHGIPAEPPATHNLASLKVESGIITAIGTERIQGTTYILKPNADGSQWAVSGSCLKVGLCEA